MNTCTSLCRTLEATALPPGGTYVVVLRLATKRGLVIGRLGRRELPRGYYAYVGSAKRGLAARLHRHIHGAVTHHWHVDYLRPQTRVIGWHTYAGDSQPECQLAGRLMQTGRIAVPGFGASDCSCTTHLLYYPRHDLVMRALRDVTADPLATPGTPSATAGRTPDFFWAT
jgi:sugar fermentation stimulation protein A